jgi:hypothetical protein
MNRRDGDVHKIAEVLGLNYRSVRSALKYIDSYLSGSTRRRKKRSYVIAAERIANQLSKRKIASEAVFVKDKGLLNNPVKELETVFVLLQETVERFIEASVKSQVGSIREENRSLSQKLEGYEKLKEEARRSNWIGNLAKKYQITKVEGGENNE